MINLTHSCLLSNNVEKMRQFYADLLGFKPQVDNQGYAEFQMDGRSVLSIFDISVHNGMALEPAKVSGSQNIILEFEVSGIEVEYRRVEEMGVKIVKPLTTQAWGNTSFWFRDPDGKLLNFYCKENSDKKESLSCCGTDCSTCDCFSDICEGCNQSEGKVFHSPEGCPIYSCAKKDNAYKNCGECAKAPCSIWYDTRDPKFSDEEFEENIAGRIDALNK